MRAHTSGQLATPPNTETVESFYIESDRESPHATWLMVQPYNTRLYFSLDMASATFSDLPIELVQYIAYIHNHTPTDVLSLALTSHNMYYKLQGGTW